jgi:hypothetical protein
MHIEYREAAVAGVINTFLGPYPILVVVEETQAHAFHRVLEGEVLTFKKEGGILTDDQTGTTWDDVRGLGTKGTLRGEVLATIPWISAYKWAWEDFYPESSLYTQ